MKKVKDVDIDHELTGTSEQGGYGGYSPPPPIIFSSIVLFSFLTK